MSFDFSFIDKLGRVVIRFFRATGRLGIFCGRTVYNCLTPPFYGRALLAQMIEIGFY